MLGFLLCTCLAISGADETTGGSNLAARVDALVNQLDARELHARDEAERKLLAIGTEALPLLPTLGQQTPPEVALRLARIQQKLLTAQAARAAEPTELTLQAKHMPLADVLAEIAKQTGNPIVDHRQNFGEQKTDVRITTNFDKTPFWQALDQVLDQGNLTLYGFTGQRGAFVVNRPMGEIPRSQRAVYAGVFRLEPARFEAVRSLRNDRERALKYFMEVTWEPRLQPIAILQPLRSVSAVGDDGQVIPVTNSVAEPEALLREGIAAAELEIPLALPKRNVAKIRSLRGKLVALIPGPRHDFRFRLPPLDAKHTLSARLEQRQAGTTVTIDQVRKNNHAWEVSLRVKFDHPSNALESHRGWILENEAFFQNSSGERIKPVGFEQTRQGRDEVGLNYLFDLHGSPDKLELVYRTPTTILELGVDYEFRDLTLP
ncbi:MAG TPA: hypothetical protein VHV08_07820 [Pirellulales bacterium]|nr:hypothetical protein [Pirellulales bacterium]